VEESDGFATPSLNLPGDTEQKTTKISVAIDNVS
jgi:hypothetical protein